MTFSSVATSSGFGGVMSIMLFIRLRSRSKITGFVGAFSGTSTVVA